MYVCNTKGVQKMISASSIHKYKLTVMLNHLAKILVIPTMRGTLLNTSVKGKGGPTV